MRSRLLPRVIFSLRALPSHVIMALSIPFFLCFDPELLWIVILLIVGVSPEVLDRKPWQLNHIHDVVAKSLGPSRDCTSIQASRSPCPESFMSGVNYWTRGWAITFKELQGHQHGKDIEGSVKPARIIAGESQQCHHLELATNISVRAASHQLAFPMLIQPDDQNFSAFGFF